MVRHRLTLTILKGVRTPCTSDPHFEQAISNLRIPFANAPVYARERDQFTEKMQTV